MRIILFSGRGGSGVSTLAAATALATARSGRRTLALSLGLGLGRALGVTPSASCETVTENLDLAQHTTDEDEFREWLGDLLDFRNMDAELAEDLAALPGINHIGRLLELEALISSRDYDVAILDAASLAMFLDLPASLEAAARWLERAFAPRQSSVFEPFVRAFAADYANAGEDDFETGRALLTRLADLSDLFTDHGKTSVRLVVAPDHSAPGDLQEATGVLSLFGYLKDAVVVTRLIPDAVTDPFFDAAKAHEKDTLAEIRTSTSAPVVTCALRREAPCGEEALLDVAREVYGNADPAAFLSEGEPWEFTRDGEHFVLSVAVPFASREELRLEQADDGIIVHLNGRRRLFRIPEEAGRREASTWTHDGRILKVTIE